MRQLLLLTFCLNVSSLLLAGDSPQFRGPDGDGHSKEVHLPLTWNEAENIRWKADIEGLGWSTPSISGNEVWLNPVRSMARTAMLPLRSSSMVIDSSSILASWEPPAWTVKRSSSGRPN